MKAPKYSVLILVMLLLAVGAQAQTIDTIAGKFPVVDGVPAKQLVLVTVTTVAVDSKGFIYIGDEGSRTIRRIDPATGLTTIVAGGGTQLDDLVPIPARSALISVEGGITFDSQNNMYLSDTVHHRVRMVKPDGTITTIVGDGLADYWGDGDKAISASLDLPEGAALDSAGNLYIADAANHAIRKVDTSGIITTIAGGWKAIDPSDNILAVNAKLGCPIGLTVDSNDNVYFSDYCQSVVRRIDRATGLIRTVAGIMNSMGGLGDDGPATSAQLKEPWGIAVASNGDLYIAQYGRVRKVAAGTGIITTILGNGKYNLGDGQLGVDVGIASSIWGLALRNNVLYAALTADNLVAKLDLGTGIFNIIAGTLTSIGDGGPALTAALTQPRRLALDTASNLYVADTFHHRVRKIASGAGGTGTGAITTVAGTGQADNINQNGPATQTQVGFPYGIFVDSQGTIYVSDYLARIRRIDSGGNMTTIAGGANVGYGGDNGAATSALLNDPFGIVKDSAGNLYLAESGNHRVRKIDASGKITTVAGTGVPGFGGDDGPATAAQLNKPSDLALDGTGLLIADSANDRIRRLDFATGKITTVVGGGYGSDGGPATSASLDDPRSIALAASGDLYIGERNRIRWVDGQSHFIQTLAGSAGAGFTGDGDLARFARLSGVQGMVLDRSGNLIVCDSVNNVIRKITPRAAIIPDLKLKTCVRGLSQEVAMNSGEDIWSCLYVSSNEAPVVWSATARTDSGGNWLKLSPVTGLAGASSQWVSVDYDYSNLAEGQYTGAITVTAPGATNSPQTLPVSLKVKAASITPRMEVDQGFLSFRSFVGGSNPPSRTLTLRNIGGGTLTWSLVSSTANGGSWLTVTPASGTGNLSKIVVSANLAGLAPAIYQGYITFTNATTKGYIDVFVYLRVNPSTASLLLSQDGASFTANEGGSFVPANNILIINNGQTSLNWTASKSWVVGGDWLKLSPSSGTVAAGSSQTLSLTATPGALRSGLYDALVTVAAPGATNAPQFISTRLNVQPGSADPVPNIRPGGLALFPVAGGAAVKDSFTVYTSGGSKPLSYDVAATTLDGKAWLSVNPAAGRLSSSSENGTVTVQVNPAQLAAGTYTGKVTLTFGTGLKQTVTVTAVVKTATSTGGSVVMLDDGRVTETACTASQNIVQYSLVDGFNVLPSQSTPLTVRVYDSCGAKLTTPTVVATFNNGDDAVILSLFQNDFYSGMWHTSKQGKVTVTFKAVSSGLPDGKLTVEGNVAPLGALGAGTPGISPHGVVNAASYAKFAPLAPGQIFSLFGTSLGTDPNGIENKTLPMPVTLNDVTVKLGSKDVPLYYVNANQVNAQVPPDTPAGQTLPMVVKVNGKVSPIELVTIAAVQPGIFLYGPPDAATGLYPGAITDKDGKVLGTTNPVSVSQYIVIYCTGLGTTTPAVTAGQASPFSPLATVNQAVTVSIGGKTAQPIFTGLTPGAVGLYQVNVQVPEGVAAGNTVPVFLQQNGVNSNIVTIPVR